MSIRTAMFLCCLTLLPTLAHAQSGAPGMTPPALSTPATEQVERYGWQILAVDAATITAGFASQSGGVLLGGYLLGGPMIHLYHGSGGRALGSLALRAGLPLGGAMIAASMAESNCTSEDSLCGLGEAIAGGMVGILAASLIDYTLLARKVTREERPPAFRYGTVSAMPNLGVSKNGNVTLGLSGSF